MVIKHTHSTPSSDVLAAVGVNLRDVTERLGGDASMLPDVCRVFTQDCPRMLGNLQAAGDARSAVALAKAAHALKGAVSNFTTGPAFETAMIVEQMARSGELEMALAAVPALTQCVTALRNALATVATAPGEGVTR
jgi:hypothetical protein